MKPKQCSYVSMTYKTWLFAIPASYLMFRLALYFLWLLGLVDLP